MSYNFIKGNKSNIDEAIKPFIESFAKAWGECWNYTTAKARLEEIVDSPNSYYLIMLNDNESVGYLFGHFQSYIDSKIFVIDEFFIDGKFRGNGYGKIMLKHLSDELKCNNITKIKLSTSRNVNAYNFYKSLGFVDELSEVTLEKDIH